MSHFKHPNLGAAVVVLALAGLAYAELATSNPETLVPVTDPDIIRKLEAAANSQAFEIVDGDTIRWRGQRVRLRGFDAFEIGQPCWLVRHGRRTAQSVDCGTHAKGLLQQIFHGLRDQIVCFTEEGDVDAYGRPLADCYRMTETGELEDVIWPMLQSCNAFGTTNQDYRRITEISRAAEAPKSWCNRERWDYEMPWTWRRNNAR